MLKSNLTLKVWARYIHEYIWHECTVESGNSKLGFVKNFFLMRDFYYSETLLDFLLYDNTDFMFTYRAHYKNCWFAGKNMVDVYFERLKLNWFNQSEPTCCHKDTQNWKQQPSKMHGVLKKETIFLKYRQKKSMAS